MEYGELGGFVLQSSSNLSMSMRISPTLDLLRKPIERIYIRLELFVLPRSLLTSTFLMCSMRLDVCHRHA